MRTALGLAVAVVAAGCTPGEQPAAAPPAQPASASEEEAAVRGLLGRLEDALRRGDPRGAQVLADDAPARAELAALTANVRRLGLTRLRLRYAGPTSQPVRPLVTGAASAPPRWVDVTLRWRLPEDRVPSRTVVPVGVRLSEGEAAFVTARTRSGSDGARVPLWLLQRVAVRRAPGVVAVASTADRAEMLRETAVDARAAVLRARGRAGPPLVVELPGARTPFERMSGVSPGVLDAVAAVTTTADGRAAGAPRVALNRALYESLGPRARRIVLTHEAVHVALQDTAGRVPAWLAEGIADHVALRGAGVPAATAAAQLVALTRADGVPATLPSAAQLEGTDPDVGAWYEASWVAVSVLADEHGWAALWRFYGTAAEDGDTVGAFGELGTTRAAFVRRWRAAVRELAR